MGAELGIEYQITSTIKATAAASYGQYLYSNNPTLYINDDARFLVLMLPSSKVLGQLI